MNAKQLIAAVAVFCAAGAAAAENTEYVEFNNVKTAKTRAEVRAELEQAYRTGQLAQPEFVEFTRVATSGKSRDEVRKEAIQAAQSERARSLYFGG